MKLQEKTFIGVLGNNDNARINGAMSAIFHHCFHHPENKRLEQFHFLFTGCTHDRLFYGDPASGIDPLDYEVARWLYDCCGVTCLPPASEGGVIVLSNFISNRQCSLAWTFFDPFGLTWLRPDTMAFLRLCDHWHVKRLMNRGAVLTWFDHEADTEAVRNRQPLPPSLCLGLAECTQPFAQRDPSQFIRHQSADFFEWSNQRVAFAEMTVALIAHSEMKPRMLDFVIDHEADLNQFGRIFATETTGREVISAAAPTLEKKMVRYHSGPKGGDIEIATSILCNECHVVIFFVDPMNEHPHIEDVRVVFQACMFKDQVVMITTEMHAREFMSRVVRGRNSLELYL